MDPYLSLLDLLPSGTLMLFLDITGFAAEGWNPARSSSSSDRSSLKNLNSMAKQL